MNSDGRRGTGGGRAAGAVPRGPNRVLEAVASPARQEIIAALGEGPATVRELAARLGRSRQALHYHVGMLVRAGVVGPAGWRGQGRAREAVYRVTMAVVAAPARRGSKADLAASERAVRAMLRLTAREVADALQTGRMIQHGNLALRGKAHLGPEGLARLRSLIADIEALLRDARQPKAGRSLYAVTVVVTPARAAGHPGGSTRQ